MKKKTMINKKNSFSRADCGDIKIEDIKFRYGSREIIFENFNAVFARGKITALVGESGSGKTTLVALIQNIYKLLEGRITIGGIDIKHIDTRDLRSLVTPLPRESTCSTEQLPIILCLTILILNGNMLIPYVKS